MTNGLVCPGCGAYPHAHGVVQVERMTAAVRLARKLAEEVLAKAAKCEYCRTNDPTVFGTATGFLCCDECRQSKPRLADLVFRPYVTPSGVLLARELLAALPES